ncbi:MAG: Tannase and feruloyl esterase [Chitinophagaceae bacterium]|nr:Tannase and feruloyl esterase [Chitinophagaceae bacterium]
MKKLTALLVLLASFGPLVLPAQNNPNSKNCIPCEQLKNLGLPDVTILEAKSFKKDSIEGQAITVPFCRVLGRISKEINFELLLPNQWNQRFLMSGGGGFVGSIQNSFRYEVNSGYATVGTDAGHQGFGVDAIWALNNMERQIDFGKLAIHLTAVVSKFLIRTYYCKDPAYSYFSGCSRGGGQAMMEAQQYPADFDGIVAGAPAFTWPAIGARFIQNSQKNYPNPKDLGNPVITKDNLKLLQQQVLKQCDALDGITDNIINDPRACKFDLSILPVCPDSLASANCLTAQQLAAIKAVYSAVMVKQDTIYPGFPFGAENEQGSWDMWIAGNNPQMKMPSLHYLFGTNLFKYLVFNNPDWDYSQYDFSKFFEETRYASAFLDATQADYTEFKKRNRKMILFHGWNDPALSAFETIKHYQEAEMKDKDIQSHIRLFLLPGVLHCGGGPGPDDVDWIALVRDWVEKGKAPERVVMSKKENGKTVMTRPVFPFPKLAVYSGKGDTNLEKNFTGKTQ